MSRSQPMLSHENRAVLVLCISGGVAGIDMLALNFLSPFVAADLHLDNAHLGSIGAGQLISWSFASVIVALLSDRIGRRKPFLIGALAAFALVSAATALATSFVTLLAARLLVGLAEGPVIPMQNTIMYSASSPERRGLNVGIVQNFGSQLLGALAGPLILVWIATHLGGWRHAFLLAGLPALAMALVVHFTIREVAPDVAALIEVPPPLGRLLKDIAGVRNIRLCFLIGACAVAWFGIMLTFVPLWAIRVLHFSPASMSLVMSSLGGAGAVGAVLVPGLSDHFGRRPIMAAFALCGVLVPIGLLFGPSSLGSVCAVVFLGSLFMGIFPLFIGVVPMESVDARQAATGLAIVMGGAQVIGGIVGPLLGGALADRWSLRAPLFLAGLLALTAAVLATMLHETLRRREKSRARQKARHEGAVHDMR